MYNKCGAILLAHGTEFRYKICVYKSPLTNSLTAHAQSEARIEGDGLKLVSAFLRGREASAQLLIKALGYTLLEIYGR